ANVSVVILQTSLVDGDKSMGEPKKKVGLIDKMGSMKLLCSSNIVHLCRLWLPEKSDFDVLAVYDKTGAVP
ncbi:hypothetical protein GCK32_020438, partial [Trichostrongylus colubriformis]